MVFILGMCTDTFFSARVHPCPLKNKDSEGVSYFFVGLTESKCQKYECRDSINENRRFRDQTDQNVIFSGSIFATLGLLVHGWNIV